MSSRKVKSYPESFRREAVRLADSPGRTATAVARELGIHPGQIYNWRTQFNKLSKGQFTVADGTNYSKEEKAEIRRLRKKVAELEQERDFLKKSDGVLRACRQVKYVTIARHRGEYPVTLMYRVLSVSRAGFYGWLAREFATGGPNRKWVTDITYIRLATGWAYLAIVLDLYSRRVVGWALASHMRESLVLEALTMALSRRRVSARLLLHSDRGVQYRGREYHQKLRDLNIQPSMSRKGNCWDNAVMESFFSRLKVELIYPEKYRTLETLRAGLFEYIEIFYNRQRRHSALGYVSPEQFERSSNPSTVSTVCG